MKVVRMTETGRNFLEARDLVLLEIVGRARERKTPGRCPRRGSHDGHAWKDHGVADVWPVGGNKLVRVGKDRRIATGARNGRRPVIVFSHDVFNEGPGRSVACKLTTQEPRAGFPLTLELTGANLPKRSWVKSAT